MHILFYHKLKKTRKSGKAPIYCRITIAGKRSEFATGIYLHPDQWKNSAACNCPQAGSFNERLAIIERDLWHIYNSGESNTITAISVKKEYHLRTYPQEQTTLQKLLSEFLEVQQQRTQPRRNTVAELCMSTVRSLQNRAVVLSRFWTEKSLCAAHDVSMNTGLQLISWMEGKRYSKNYTHKTMQIFKQVCDRAVITGLISSNPIEKIRVKRPTPTKTYLLESVLKKIELSDWPREVLQKTADMAICQAYTGFSYADLMKISERHIVRLNKKEWIIDFRKKTDSPSVIPLFPKAKQIFEKYNYRLPLRSNGLYNRYLKELQHILGLQMHLTTHVFRRTFGQHRLNEGLGIGTVARMLGHELENILN